MRLAADNTRVYLSCGLYLDMKHPCIPWRKTRADFIRDEMTARKIKSSELRNMLDSAHATMIRDAVGEGLITLEDARNLGEGFLGEIGANDFIRANCRAKPVQQMTRDEFIRLACYVDRNNNLVFVENDPGFLPMSIPGGLQAIDEAYNRIKSL